MDEHCPSCSRKRRAAIPDAVLERERIDVCDQGPSRTEQPVPVSSPPTSLLDRESPVLSIGLGAAQPVRDRWNNAQTSGDWFFASVEEEEQEQELEALEEEVRKANENFAVVAREQVDASPHPADEQSNETPLDLSARRLVQELRQTSEEPLDFSAPHVEEELIEKSIQAHTGRQNEYNPENEELRQFAYATRQETLDSDLDVRQGDGEGDAETVEVVKRLAAKMYEIVPQLGRNVVCNRYLPSGQYLLFSTLIVRNEPGSNSAAHRPLSPDPLPSTSRDTVAPTLKINYSSSVEVVKRLTAKMYEIVPQLGRNVVCNRYLPSGQYLLFSTLIVRNEPGSNSAAHRPLSPDPLPSTSRDTIAPTLKINYSSSDNFLDSNDIPVTANTDHCIEEDKALTADGGIKIESDEAAVADRERLTPQQPQTPWGPPTPAVPQKTEDTEAPTVDADELANDKKSSRTTRKKKEAHTETKEAEKPTRSAPKRKAAENAEHKIEQMRKDAEAAFKAGSRECGKCRHHGVHNPVHRHVCMYRDCVCSLGCDKVQIKRDLTANDYNSRMAAKRKRTDVVAGLRGADQSAPIPGTPGLTASETIPVRQDPPQHPKKHTNGAPAGDGVPVVEEQAEEADEQPGPSTRYPNSPRSPSPDNEV